MSKARSAGGYTRYDRQVWTDQVSRELTADWTFGSLDARRAAAKAEAAQLLGGPVVTDDLDRTFTLPDFTKQVQAGVKLMDEKMPGWWRHIDTSALDLQSESSCVLGQTWQHYAEGSELTRNSRNTTGFRAFAARLFGGSAADEHRDDSAAHGFNITREQGKLLNLQVAWTNTGAAWNRAWEHLTETWLEAIRAKQEHHLTQEEVAQMAYSAAMAEGKTHGQALLASAQAVAVLA